MDINIKKMERRVKTMIEHHYPILKEYSGRDYAAYRGMGQKFQQWLYFWNNEQGKYMLNKEHEKWDHSDKHRDAYYGIMLGGDEGSTGKKIENSNSIIRIKVSNPTGTDTNYTVSAGGISLGTFQSEYTEEEKEEIEFIIDIYNRIEGLIETAE